MLTGALTTRILFEGDRATGVEFEYEGLLRQAKATLELILSQGAIQTPKLLMQSGIGDEQELARFDIPVRQHLPGVGRNLHDHVALGLVWEATDAPLPQIARSSSVAFWKTDPSSGRTELLHLRNRHTLPHTGKRSQVPSTGSSLDVVYGNAAGKQGVDSPDRRRRPLPP